MNKEDLQFDEFIRKKLGDHSVPPSPGVWSGIEDKLLAKRRRKWIIYYRIAGIAAMLLVAFVAGWYYFSSEEVPGERTALKENMGSEQPLAKEMPGNQK